MSRRKHFIYLSLLLYLNSCYETEKAQGIAYFRNTSSGSIVIELPYTIKGRGSFHNFDLKRYTGNGSQWIIINKFEKTIPADSLGLYSQLGYSSQSDLKGDVKIEDSILTIRFKIPKYNSSDVVKSWENYRFNGIYRLVKRL